MGNDWNNQFWCYVWLLQSLILKSSLLGKLFLVWFQLHLIIRWVILVLSRETKIFRDWLYVAWLKENVYNCLTCDCQEICIRIFNVLLDKKMKAWHLLFFFFSTGDFSCLKVLMNELPITQRYGIWKAHKKVPRKITRWWFCLWDTFLSIWEYTRL